MTRRLRQEVSRLSKPIRRGEIFGIAGATINGQRQIDVQGRDGFIYVRLRDNQSEFIQVYNEALQNVYWGVPVTVKRQGNRYVTVGKDSQRYPEWSTQQFSSNTADVVQPQITDMRRHGGTHSFDRSNKNGGGDISWIYSRQFLPLLVSPYSATSTNVYIVAQTIRDREGNWKYVGNTGTANLVNYKPTTGGQAYFGLVYIDSDTGNPHFLLNSGTPAPPNITGTDANILPYVPEFNNPSYIPLAFVRLETGTSYIGWDNLYDARQFNGGGAGAISVNNTGTYSNLNFTNASVITSGTSAFIEFLANGGTMDSTLFYVEGRLATGTNMSNMYLITQPTTINQIGLYVDYLGVTGTTIIDVNLTRSGTTSTIFSTQANRPLLQYNDATGWVLAVPDITSFGAGDVLSLDIDSVSTLSDTLVIGKLTTGTSSSLGGGISVEEADGSPSVNNVQKIKFAGSAVTDDGGGIVTVTPTTPAMVKLGEVEVSGAAAANMSIPGIPTGYKNLVVMYTGRSTKAGTTEDTVRMTMNGDTGSNYVFSRTNRFGSSNSSSAAYIETGDIPADGSTTGMAQSTDITIFDYLSSTWWKGLTGVSNNLQSNTPQNISGAWKSTNAVTSITLTPASGSWKIGSKMTLYGVL